MNFQTYLNSREYFFSIGIETDSGQHYLSFPVSNRLVDCEEYYRIDADDYARDLGSALEFVERCRRWRMNHLLLIAPGSDHGRAW